MPMDQEQRAGGTPVEETVDPISLFPCLLEAEHSLCEGAVCGPETTTYQTQQRRSKRPCPLRAGVIYARDP